MPNEASLRCIVCGDTKKESEVSFFRIPDDPKRSCEWLKAVNRMDLIGKSSVQLRNCRVCANHFSEQCFNSDLRHRLTRCAVPSLAEPCKVPRLDEYSQTLKKKISVAFLEERTGLAARKNKTNGWEECNISDSIVPFRLNGENASHRVSLSRSSLPSVMYNAEDHLECGSEENNTLTMRSHSTPEPFPASLFCEVSYGTDHETQATNNSTWQRSTFLDHANKESDSDFSVRPICSLSISLQNKTSSSLNVSQRNCVTADSHPSEETVNGTLKEHPAIVPDLQQSTGNEIPYPVSLFCSADNNIDGEYEGNNMTDERNSASMPSSRKRKHVIANSLLAQYMNFLRERDVAKQKRHEEKMEELRKNNELLGRLLTAIEKE